ncbi:MAG: MmgE/PrpD family protein, partial [Victivallales bacterium]|nr:MmgE/PrpD family protein [Victivallales bacterium]
RTVSAIGAALAHSITIDGLDIHDNYNAAKGHAGVALVPAMFAALAKSKRNINGKEFLTTLTVGYEIALRAGLALHATACDYHTSGAWNSLGCASIVARMLELNDEQTRHALGIAEYYGPRSQMMRCIDHPTMLKDGSGWGALSGVSAGILAKNKFTGAPALTVESDEVSKLWSDLGEKWYTPEQDFKKYAVCHWAQPALACVLELIHNYNLQSENISEIHVHTFNEATHLSTRRPQKTEEAQYSLPFSVAAATVFKQLGPEELSGSALNHPEILKCIDKIKIFDDEECNEKFPELQTAWVKIIADDGREYVTEPKLAPWDAAGIPATDDDIIKKYFWLAENVVEKGRAQQINDTVWALDDVEDSNYLRQMLS